MNISIGRPQKDDFDELSELFAITIRDCFRREGIDEKYADELPDEIEFQVRTLKRDFATNGKEEHFFIARVGEKIVGSAAVGTTTGGVMRALGLKEPSIPELKSGYVLPEYQGRGIGSRLIDKCILLLDEQGVPEFAFECGYQLSQGLWKKRFGEPIVVKENKFGEGADQMFWRCRTADALRT